MAKPQRMFLVTVLCLFQTLAPAAWQVPWLPYGLGAPAAVLSLIIVGCMVTSCTRLSAVAAKLRAEP